MKRILKRTISLISAAAVCFTSMSVIPTFREDVKALEITVNDTYRGIQDLEDDYRAQDAIHIDSPILINSSNVSQYNNKLLTGELDVNAAPIDMQDYWNRDAGIVIDGVSVTLNIAQLTVDYGKLKGQKYDKISAIALRNGATLNLNFYSDNKLTGLYGGAGIAVPEGCTLNLNGDTYNGVLTVEGGDGDGGGGRYRLDVGG